MTINQVTAANTFSHWLGATQQLINKYNAFETDLDNVANTANNVLVIKNDTQNIYSNTVNVYNAANNVYQDIIDYTSTAYATANSAKDLANTAINNAQDAYDLSVAAYAEASNAYSTSEIAAATAENANTVATDILNNIGDYANTAANNVIYPIFDIDNVNSDNDTYYPTLTESPEYLSKVVVSTARMSFIPATGTLTANTFNATTDIKFNGSVIANSSGWVGTTIPIAKGGTGATTDSQARTNLGLAIGTNVQEYSAKLTDIAALSVTNNNFIVANGSSWTSKSAEDSRTALGLNLGTDAYKLVQTVSGGGLTTVDRGTDGYYLKQSSTGFTWDVGPGSLNATSPLVISGGTISLNQNFAGSSSVGGAATSVANELTFSNAGSGNTDSYNGSVGKTISYNSVGAPKVDGTGASGTWGISITGNAATADKLLNHSHDTNSGISLTNFSQADGTFRLTNFFGSQRNPGGVGIYIKNNYSNVAGMLYAAQGACGLASDNGLTYAAPSHTWFIDKVQEMFLDSGFLRPFTNNGLSLGASNLRWNIAYITNGVTTGSDARSKKDIVESNLGLDFILRLNPVSYKWKEDSSKAPAELVDRTNFGFIAQEVEESLEGQDFGGLMYDSQTDLYGLRYEQFIAPLTKAIQEQQEIIKSLELRIETLEKSANVSL